MTETPAPIRELYPKTRSDAAATLVYRLQEDEQGSFASYQDDTATMWEVFPAPGGWAVKKMDLRAGTKSETRGGFKPTAVCLTLREWGLPVDATWVASQAAEMRPSHVYLIGSDASDLVKIGRSDDVQRRLTDIQRMCPVPLKLLWVTPGDAVLEAQLHRALAGQRAHGEWFHLGSDPVGTVSKAVSR